MEIKLETFLINFWVFNFCMHWKLMRTKNSRFIVTRTHNRALTCLNSFWHKKFSIKTTFHHVNVLFNRPSMKLVEFELCLCCTSFLCTIRNVYKGFIWFHVFENVVKVSRLSIKPMFLNSSDKCADIISKKQGGNGHLKSSAVIRIHKEATTQVSACSSIKWNEHMCVGTHMPAREKSFSFPLIILKTHLHRSWKPAVLCEGEFLKAFYLNFMLFFLSPFSQAASYVNLENLWNSWKIENESRIKEWNLEFRASMNEFEYRYICCFFSGTREILPFHVYTSSIHRQRLNVTKSEVKNDVARKSSLSLF